MLTSAIYFPARNKDVIKKQLLHCIPSPLYGNQKDANDKLEMSKMKQVDIEISWECLKDDGTETLKIWKRIGIMKYVFQEVKKVFKKGQISLETKEKNAELLCNINISI